jgi:hypothetical protein
MRPDPQNTSDRDKARHYPTDSTRFCRCKCSQRWFCKAIVVFKLSLWRSMVKIILERRRFTWIFSDRKVRKETGKMLTGIGVRPRNTIQTHVKKSCVQRQENKASTWEYQSIDIATANKQEPAVHFGTLLRIVPQYEGREVWQAATSHRFPEREAP